MLIGDIYHPHPQTIYDQTTIVAALKELIRDDVNGLIVLNNSKKVVGVLSLQDIAAATVPRQFRKNIGMAAAMYRKGFFTEMCQSIKDKTVKEIMRKDFVSVTLEDNIMAITADFLKNDLYIVPVMKDKKLVGVVTRTEIKAALAYGMGLTTGINLM